MTTALHVSGVTITHLQEHKTTVTTASGNRYTVLLSAAIVENLSSDNERWQVPPDLICSCESLCECNSDLGCDAV